MYETLRRAALLGAVLPMTVVACQAAPTAPQLPDLTRLTGSGADAPVAPGDTTPAAPDTLSEPADSVSETPDTLPGDDPPDGLTVDTLFASAYTGFAEARQEVLDDEAAWASAWATLTSGTDPAPGLPAVDFSARRVVIVATGQKPTGGHSIEIVSVSAVDEGLRVEVVERSPSPGCLTSQAITSPALAVTVPRIEGTVAFDVTRAWIQCG